MVLTKMFEDVFYPAFYSRSCGLTTKGFFRIYQFDIIENLQRLYGKQSYQDLDAALLRLNELINQMQPVEVILRVIEEV